MSPVPRAVLPRRMLNLSSLFRVAASELSWRFFSQITDAHNCAHPLSSTRRVASSGTRAAARVSRSGVDERSRGGSRRIRPSRRRHATSSAGSSNEAHFSFRAAAVSDLVFQPNEGCAQLCALPLAARSRTDARSCARARATRLRRDCVSTLVRTFPKPAKRGLGPPGRPPACVDKCPLWRSQNDLSSLFRRPRRRSRGGFSAK